MRAFRNIYDDFIRAHWTATPILAAENEQTDQPSDLSPWLSVEVTPFFEELISFGAPCYRAEGEITLRIWIASGTDPQQALDYIEQLRNIHRGMNIGEGVQLLTASPADIGSGSSEGNWFDYLTHISYMHNYRGPFTIPPPVSRAFSPGYSSGFA